MWLVWEVGFKLFLKKRMEVERKFVDVVGLMLECEWVVVGVVFVLLEFWCFVSCMFGL